MWFRWGNIQKKHESPLTVNDPEVLYYEPFMRQTLLRWEMVQYNEYDCDELIHLHTIPKENRELKERITSPRLTGKDISEAWKAILKKPQRYRVLFPEDLLKPAAINCADIKALLSYLEERY